MTRGLCPICRVRPPVTGEREHDAPAGWCWRCNLDCPPNPEHAAEWGAKRARAAAKRGGR